MEFRRSLDYDDANEPAVEFCCRKRCGPRCPAKDVRFYIKDILKFGVTFALTFIVVYANLSGRVDAELRSIKERMDTMTANLERIQMSLGVITDQAAVVECEIMDASAAIDANNRQIANATVEINRLVVRVDRLNVTTLIASVALLGRTVDDAFLATVVLTNVTSAAAARTAMLVRDVDSALQNVAAALVAINTTATEAIVGVTAATEVDRLAINTINSTIDRRIDTFWSAVAPNISFVYAAVTSSWQSYVPTFDRGAQAAAGTVLFDTVRYKVTGNIVCLHGLVDWGLYGSGSGGAIVGMSLPPGLPGKLGIRQVGVGHAQQQHYLDQYLNGVATAWSSVGMIVPGEEQWLRLTNFFRPFSNEDAPASYSFYWTGGCYEI